MPVDRAEFAATMERLYSTTDEGFKSLIARLDLLNGRTLKSEIAHAKLDQRVVSLEKETFHHRRGDTTGKGITAAGASFTKREAALIAFGFSVFAAMLKLIEWLGGQVWHSVTK